VHIFIVFVGNANVKCKAEANSPGLLNFITEHRFFAQYSSEEKKIIVVTDDMNIKDDIAVFGGGLDFINPEPAPKRIVDKVSIFFLSY